MLRRDPLLVGGRLIMLRELEDDDGRARRDVLAVVRLREMRTSLHRNKQIL